MAQVFEIKHGLKRNIETYYYPSGQKKESRFYNATGQLDGGDSLFNKDGTLLEVSLYNYGIKVEEWTYYPDGQPKSQVGIENDSLRDGEYRLYSETGGLLESTIYDSGVKNGLHTAYFENGVTKEEGRYDGEGRKIGRWNENYESGEPKSTGIYYSGEKYEKWFVWSPKGKRKKIKYPKLSYQ